MVKRVRTASQKHPKPRLLLDEGLPPRQSFRKLNQYCYMAHIKLDLGYEGEDDSFIYALAQRENRIVVTFNIKHFRPIITQSGGSVIGLSTNLSTGQIDTKLTSFVKQVKPPQFRGQYFFISSETQIKHLLGAT